MKRYLLIGTAALLAACSNGNDGPVDPSEAVYECPKDQWLANAEYLDAGKIEATDDFAAYHAANGARKGVVTTDSGLQYKVVKKGLKKGATPVGSQRVEMHYHGFFPDGSVFDSSIDRDKTMTHNANGFIKGWNESLADMKICEARVLYIPGDIAYGAFREGSDRPTGTLLFHMQLLGIKQ